MFLHYSSDQATVKQKMTYSAIKTFLLTKLDFVDISLQCVDDEANSEFITRKIHKQLKIRQKIRLDIKY